MSDQNRKTDSSANQQLDGTSAKSVEDATTARDAEESGIRKVNLRDMPPAQKDEVGGPRGPEPTRYGDWERKGRVSDF